MQKLIIAAALVWAAISLPSYAQELPAEVVAAYERHVAAVQSGDNELAASTGVEAWQLAEDAQIDTQTLTVLAQNAASASVRIGDHQTAQDAYLHVAELRVESEGEGIVAANALRLAAESAFRVDDADGAVDIAERAVSMLEAQPASELRNQELARALGLQAIVDWRAGNFRSAGSHSKAALSAVMEADLQSYTDLIQLSLMAGIYDFFEGEYEDAAFWFAAMEYHVAIHDASGMTAVRAGAWSEHARDQLNDEEGASLLRRIVQAGLLPPQCEEDCEATVEDSEAQDAGVLRVDAEREYAPNPEYPVAAAERGIEGLAMLQFDIDENGETTNLQVIASVPVRDFGEVGAAAIERWRYSPALRDGEPVTRTGVTIHFDFKLRD